MDALNCLSSSALAAIFTTSCFIVTKRNEANLSLSEKQILIWKCEKKHKDNMNAQTLIYSYKLLLEHFIYKILHINSLMQQTEQCFYKQI